MNHPLTRYQLRLINEHNALLLLSAQKAIDRLKQIPERQRDEGIQNQLKYWTNVKSTLSWSNGIAQQRCMEPAINV